METSKKERRLLRAPQKVHPSKDEDGIRFSGEQFSPPPKFNPDQYADFSAKISGIEITSKNLFGAGKQNKSSNPVYSHSKPSHQP